MSDLREAVRRAIWTAPLEYQPPGFAVRAYPPADEGVRKELARQADAALAIARPIIEREMVERCAGVAEDTYDDSDWIDRDYAARTIAQNIRALTEKPR